MPVPYGSTIIDDNAPGVFSSEVPEPANFAFLGRGLMFLGHPRRQARSR